MRISVENISKKFQVDESGIASYPTLRDIIAGAFRRKASKKFDFWAVRDLSFEVGAGECVGLLGRNGSGKSTTLKMLSRIVSPTNGRIRMEGRVASLLEVGTGFHPELTGRENIFVNGAILGMSRSEVRRKFDEIVDFSECEAFLDTPVKRYSSGMYTRLAFAVGAHLDPDVLIVDEVLAVGDTTFQKKCLGRMGAASKEGRTVIFVSHSMQAVQALCSRAIVLNRGELQFDGEVQEALSLYASSSAAGGPSKEDIAAALAGLGGDEVARIVEFDVHQPDRNSLLLGNDRAVNVEVDVLINEPVAGLRVGVDLSEPLGGLLFRSFHDEFAQDAPATLGRGLWRFSFSFPGDQLGPLTYSLGASLWVYGRGQIPGQRVEFDFPAEDRTGVNAMRPGAAFQGRVMGRGSWRVDQANGD